MSKLKIQTGHPVTADVKDVAASVVRFVTADDRTMFEFRCGDDGRSIEVRSVETTKIDGVIYDNRLLVAPTSTNGVNITVSRYAD